MAHQTLERFAGTIASITDEVRSKQVGGYLQAQKALSESETYQLVATYPEADRTEVVRYLYSHGAPSGIPGEIFRALLRRQLSLQPNEILGWLENVKKESDADRFGMNIFGPWPCAHLIQQIERYAKKKPLSEDNLSRLRAMKDWPEFNQSHSWGTDMRRVLARIDKILSVHSEQVSAVPEYLRLGGDEFGRTLERRRSFLFPDAEDQWNTIFNLAGTALGSKPTKTFEKGLAEIKEVLGKEVLRKHLHEFLEASVDAPITEVNKWPPRIYFSDQNTALVKGLVWMSMGFRDKKTVHLIADLCEKGMKKIPACGIASQAVANACFLYLEATPGADVAARLSRLALMIRQKTVKERIQTAIANKAEAAGLSAAELEERVVPDFGLSTGQKSVPFKGYTLEIALNGPGAVTQTWLRADGTPQKTKPKIVGTDKKLKAKFDEMKKEVSDLKKTATGQRNRIDRLFAEDMCWSLEDLLAYYINHPLVGVLARKLIWSFEQEDGSFTPALFDDDGWKKSGSQIDPHKAKSVRLWHPVESDVDAVLSWRQRLIELGIVQPTKQAYREVY